MQAGHGSRHVPRAIVETATDPAGELGHIQLPAAATTAWTQEPRHCPVGPHGRHPNPVDQKIGVPTENEYEDASTPTLAEASMSTLQTASIQALWFPLP